MSNAPEPPINSEIAERVDLSTNSVLDAVGGWALLASKPRPSNSNTWPSKAMCEFRGALQIHAGFTNQQLGESRGIDLKRALRFKVETTEVSRKGASN